MLNLEEAIQLAKDYLAQSFPDFAGNDLRLEEVESPLQAGAWSFTFSAAADREPTGNSLLDALRARRVQKLVQVEKESGFLLAVKNKAA